MAGWDSPWHIAIFALVVLLVFGSKKLPEIGRSVGTGMREFKRSITGHDEPSRPALTTGTTDAPAPRADQPSRERDTIA